MITIENVEVIGWEHAIRGMRNPMNSWERSDSCTQGPVWCNEFCDEIFASEPDYKCGFDTGLRLGPNDYERMTSLSKGGPVHAKYRRMITVYLDITAPLYWWKEFDTYKVGTVANSCSTMHKIHDKEFTMDDFSHEHLTSINKAFLEMLVGRLNIMRIAYLVKTGKRGNIPTSKEAEEALNLYSPKDIWWQMIQLLPTSYNQRRTVMLNYEVLAGIYEHRNTHKLDEWRDFCRWIESLPYSDIIIGEKITDAERVMRLLDEGKTPNEVREIFGLPRIDRRTEEVKNGY